MMLTAVDHCHKQRCPIGCSTTEMYHFGWGVEARRAGITIDDALCVSPNDQLKDCIRRGYEKETARRV